MRRFACDNYRFDFQSIKERIGEQIFDLAAKLAQPLRLFLCDEVRRQGHKVWWNRNRLYAEQHDAAAIMTRKRSGVFQRRTRMRRKVGREENVAKRHRQKSEVRDQKS